MRFVLLLILLGFSLSSCGFENRNVAFFRDTEAFDLAKAVDRNDTVEIEKLVAKDSKLLEMSNPTSGSNVLVLAVVLGKFEAFKTLLKLGANPNFINPYDKHSVLIEACRFYDWPTEYSTDLRFTKLLLQKGANPNYCIKNDFTNEKGISKRATSPIYEASTMDLSMVKLLLKYGADPFIKIGTFETTPFEVSYSLAQFEISLYYIDSLQVNPKDYVFNDLSNRKSIQDWVMTEFCMAKIFNDSSEIDKLIRNYPEMEKANQKTWFFVQKLQKMGIDFKSYEYKDTYLRKYQQTLEKNLAQRKKILDKK